MSVAATDRHGDTRESPLRLHGVRTEPSNALLVASMHFELLARSRGQQLERGRIEAVRDALDQALGLSERLTGELDTGACCEHAKR